MDIYTLSSEFLPNRRINQFTSAIWTERYFTAGDCEIVVGATKENLDLLKPGTWLWKRGSMEVMQIQTVSIEDGLLTAKGESALAFLKERWAWFASPAYDGSNERVSELRTDTLTAGELISHAVDVTVISATNFGTYWAPATLNFDAEKIPGLILGPVDTNGSVEQFAIALGALYESIQSLARDEGVGLKLYLASSSYDSGFVFKFATYRGKNRTSEQSAHTVVRLTPKMDALNDVSEIRSIDQYKNVVYVNYKTEVSVHYIRGMDPPTGFNRRTIVVDAPDVFFDPALPDYADKVAAFRTQVAQNTFANAVYIQAVDGKVSSKIPYTYGVDYGLGDVIELQGYTDAFSKARIVEYIHSKDQYGEQEYPTLSVLDPDFIGYMPDLEPNDDFPEWYNDPDFDIGDDVWSDDEYVDDQPTSIKDPNPDPEPDFGDNQPHANFTWEIT